MIDLFAFYMIHGVIVLGAMMFFFAGCRPPESKGPCSYITFSRFDATNAMAEVKALAIITPRHSGSPGAEKAAEYLLNSLGRTGVKASLDKFEEETPSGKMIFRNVIGVIEGRTADGKPADKWIIVGAHYDAKSGISENFQGANDSCSGAGVLLELSRVIASSPRLPVNVLIAFFDGEECQDRYTKHDGLHGSRRLAEQLVRNGRAGKVCAVIILDMVGARDLNVTIPHNSAIYLVSTLFQAAEAEGTRDKFSLWSTGILDDHVPFISAGMPAIDIIDFEYGSAPGRNDYWHTPEDTIDKLSLQSLEIIGKTTLRLLDNLMRDNPGFRS